jgi:hypothetical protein
MTNVWNFIVAHQLSITTTLTAIVTWITNVGFTKIVSALPAPAATSSTRYIFWFKFLNNFMGNASRANNSAVESSPNFQAAVDIQTTQAGVPPITVQPVIQKENK